MRINDQTYNLQQSVLPKLYKNQSLRGDIRWLSENDSVLVTFWNEKGDTALHILTEISGIEWVETDFNINLLRYYPSIGSSNPIILPLGGIDNGKFIEAAAEGNRLKMNLIYFLARRMLDQADIIDAAGSPIASHPLMRTGIYRRDNLAMLLTLTTCYSIMGIDSTESAFSSSFWRNKFPGREIFKNYFRDSWILTPDHTLSDWLISEPYNSRLVSVTRPPRKQKPQAYTRPAKYIEYLPLKGQLGFSVKKNESSQLMVYKIDMFRMGYASGLREGDIIRRVDGRLVRNHKQLVEYILENLEQGGAVVEISQDGITKEIIIQPIDTPFMDDEYYDYDYDSLYYDSIPDDSLENPEYDY